MPKSTPPTGDVPSTPRPNVDIGRPRQAFRAAGRAAGRAPHWAAGWIEAEHLSFRAGIAYRRVLEEFALIAKQIRKHRKLGIAEVAERTAIPERRLKSFEAGTTAVSWPEVMLLSSVYHLPVSYITTRLNRSFASVARQDSRRIKTQLLLRRNRAAEFETSVAERDAIIQKLKDTVDGSMVDATLADWPSCLLPSLGDSIRGDCYAVVLQLEVLSICIAKRGRAIPLRIVDDVGLAKSGATDDISVARCGDLLAAVRQDLAMIVVSLGWHLRRHFQQEEDAGAHTKNSSSPPRKDELVRQAERDLRQQRALIRRVIVLLAPFATQSSGAAARARFDPVGLEAALSQAVTQLVRAGRRLSDVAKRFP